MDIMDIYFVNEETTKVKMDWVIRKKSSINNYLLLQRIHVYVHTYLFEVNHHFSGQFHVLEHSLQFASEVGTAFCDKYTDKTRDKKKGEYLLMQ